MPLLQIEKTPEEVAEDIINFFSREKMQKVIEEGTNRDGSTFEQVSYRTNPMPTLEEWCIKERVTKRTLTDFARAFPLVAEAIEFARDVMKAYLIEKGLDGSYDARMVTFVASNETDMKIKSEVQATIKEPSKVLVEIEAGEKKLVEGRLLPPPLIEEKKRGKKGVRFDLLKAPLEV